MIRFAATLTALFLFVSCSKKDLPIFEHFKQQNFCVVESMNADRQNSDEFYFVKTFDQRGVVTHIKTQLREVHTTSYVYDHDIFYSLKGATLKGVKKTYGWYNSDPEDQNSPLIAEELVELRDSNNIEVLFDRQSKKPIEVRSGPGGQSVLKLSYNHRGFLTKVGDYNVTTDSRGNIKSILTPPYEGEYYHGQVLGVWYSYSDDSTKKRNQYYETPNIMISSMYSLLEVLNWGDLQPDRERTGAYIQYAFGDEYYPVQPLIEANYSNHQYDSDGKLLGYTFAGNFYEPLPYSYTGGIATRTIGWRCKDSAKPEVIP